MSWPKTAGTKFEPGNNANPGGRPKGSSVVKELFNLAGMTYDQVKTLAETSQNIRERTAARIWLDAAEGKKDAVAMVTNRESGAVQQSTKIEVTQLSPEQVLESIALERERLELASEND